MSFKAGDVVRMRSGGPTMTVAEVEDQELKGPCRVKVVWVTFDGTAGVLDSLPVECLENITACAEKKS